MLHRFFKILFTLLFLSTISFTSEDVEKPIQSNWSFDGMLGVFDLASIQRGFKVYREVCAACHSVDRIAFRNLASIGFSDLEILSVAKEYTILDGPNDDGEMFERPAKPSDKIPGPYKNEKAARAANNGAYPPNLSLIIKARKDGANYVYSLLTGYKTPPKNFILQENMHYNPYFASGGKQLAMTPPLIKDGQVEYKDGTKPSINQMAKDVVNFLQWVAEPEMEERKSIGVSAMAFSIFFTIMFYFAMKRIWSRISSSK